MRRLLIAGGAMLCAVTASFAQDRVFQVPVDLNGPLGTVRFEALGVSTEVQADLERGESRTVLLPFGGGSLAGLDPVEAASALEIQRPNADGEVVVHWSRATSAGDAPRGLGKRARPPVAPARPHPDLARWLVIAAGAVAAFGVRRKPWASAATGVVAALLIAILPAEPLEARRTLVVDGDFQRDRWLEVTSAHGRVEVESGECSWFETRGPETPLWRVDPGGDWSLQAAGVELHLLRELRSGPLDPSSRQPVFALRQVWSRSSDGRWTARDDWEPGADFPPPACSDAARGGPAGWLAAGLPQGVSVLIGRPGALGAPDWLRITAFPALESDERH